MTTPEYCGSNSNSAMSKMLVQAKYVSMATIRKIQPRPGQFFEMLPFIGFLLERYVTG